MIINRDFQRWCPTEVDQDGIFQGDPNNGNDPWGYCWHTSLDTPHIPDCPTHEETLTWRKDETVKMTLQYNNPALWTGLEWYGILLTCFLLYSLILTALISAIGKIIIGGFLEVAGI